MYLPILVEALVARIGLVGNLPTHPWGDVPDESQTCGCQERERSGSTNPAFWEMYRIGECKIAATGLSCDWILWGFIRNATLYA